MWHLQQLNEMLSSPNVTLESRWSILAAFYAKTFGDAMQWEETKAGVEPAYYPTMTSKLLKHKDVRLKIDDFLKLFHSYHTARSTAD